jgi:hypothetical protein
MIRSFLKRKLSDNQLANIFVNGLLEVIDNGFSDVAQLINDDPAFEVSPNIPMEDNSEFSIIILVGNIICLESSFDNKQALDVEKLIIEKLSVIYGMNYDEFKTIVKNYSAFIARVNHPSKNVIYGISKAIFHKYKLNDFQEEYFRRMQAPNPLFLKRLDEITSNFIWDWDNFFKKYKV